MTPPQNNYIDVHTHAFHPKIAAKAVDQLRTHYEVEIEGLGTVKHLIAKTQRNPGALSENIAEPGLGGENVFIDRCVVLCAATSAAQVIPANNFALELKKHCPQFVPFGTIHPNYEDWEVELARLKQHGIQGLKLHPDFQGFRLDDPRLLPIIEAAHKDFVFLCHIGDKLPPAQNPSCPYKMRDLIDNFPDARFIAAHFGGYLHWKYSLEVLAGREIYFDTSSTLPLIDDLTLAGILKKHSRELLLFGSDYPMFDPQKEIKFQQKRLKFTDQEMESLLRAGNKLFGV